MPRLPYDYDRLDNPRIVICDPRDWRNTPRVRVGREMEPYLDEIACEAANEISDKAKDNHFRTFHYNMMSRNDWRNDDFEKLVQFICDIIDYRYTNREIHRIDEELRESVERSVTMHCSKQAHDFPDLMDDCDRIYRGNNVIRAVQANIAQFFRIVDDMERLGREDQRDVRSYRRAERDDRDVRGYSSRDTRDTRTEYRRDDRYSGRRDYRRDEPVVSGREIQERSYSEGLREEPRHVEDMFVPPTSNGRSTRAELPRSRDYITRPDMEFQSTVTPLEPTAPPPAPVTQEQRAIVPAAPPAPPPEEDNEFFNGTFGKHPLLKMNGKTHMDALAHAAVYPANADVPFVDMREEVERVLTLEEAVISQLVTKEQIEGSVEEVEHIQIFNSVQTLAQNFSEDCAARMIEESGENSAGVRKVYHTFGIVDNAMAGFKHLNDIRVMLRDFDSMRGTLSALKRVMAAVNKHAAPASAYATDMRAAVRRFDRIITREINIYCREVIKISDGNAIKSAISDFPALVDVLHEKATPAHNDAFMAFISQLNGSMREAMKPELNIEKSVIDAAEIDTEKMGIAMLPMSYLVTHLPFTMSELGVEVNGSAVIDTNRVTPFMKACLDASDIESSDFSTPNRLLVTRDLEVFRVYAYPGMQHALVLVPVEMN